MKVVMMNTFHPHYPFFPGPIVPNQSSSYARPPHPYSATNSDSPSRALPHPNFGAKPHEGDSSTSRTSPHVSNPFHNAEIVVPSNRQGEADMERGLGIDFYRVHDTMLLASWASYYRDQFLQLRTELDNLRRMHDSAMDQLRRRDADALVHLVQERKIMTGSELHDLYRMCPLLDSTLTGISAVEIESELASSCFQAIFQQVELDDDEQRRQRFLPFDTPEWRSALWYQHGLKELIGKAHVNFRNWYTEIIWESVDAYLEDQMAQHGQVSQSFVKSLFQATRDGLRQSLAYRKLMPIYAAVIARLERGRRHTSSISTSKPLSSLLTSDDSEEDAPSRKIQQHQHSKRTSTEQQSLQEQQQSLQGKRITECFGHSEEAFVIFVIRKYLRNKFGSELGVDEDLDHEDHLGGADEDDAEPIIKGDDMDHPHRPRHHHFYSAFTKKDVATVSVLGDKLKAQHAQSAERGDPLGVFHFGAETADNMAGDDTAPRAEKRARRQTRRNAWMASV